MPRKRPPLILALDPGTKEMGIAVLEGDDLLDYRVKTFRNEGKPHELLGQAKATMVALLEEVHPDIVVIEKPFFAKTKRSALLTFLVQELRGRVKAGNVLLREYGPREVREILLGDPQARKQDIARFVVGTYPELRAHFHPGDFWKEKYWGHVFDAVGLGMATVTTVSQRGPK